jgi:light-regulated signal transduction histidine kinase (bacteriophytochrome)
MANPTERKGIEILVVDDASSSRLVLATVLRRAGYTVSAASDGAEAWTLLRESSISMVVCDWMMPEMDGLELCRRVRESNAGHYTYFILCTARGNKTDFMEAMGSGIDDFISKPVDPEELRVRVAAGERVLQLEQELRRRQQELEQKNTELEQFAYIASHDLQAPLRKIQSFAKRLTVRHTGSFDEQAHDYLTRINHAAERMQGLIDDLLTLARVTSRVNPFRVVELTKLLQEVISDLEPQIEKAAGEVEVGALPAVEGDETQLRQVFQNLIGNAVKFQRPGTPPSVRIYLRGDEADDSGSEHTGDCHEIIVEDNGIGFDNRDATKIFQIFQRLHGQGEYEGTGIGLAVCKKIVERHRGRISASSEPNKGTKFIVALPRASTSGGETK